MCMIFQSSMYIKCRLYKQKSNKLFVIHLFLWPKFKEFTFSMDLEFLLDKQNIKICICIFVFLGFGKNN